MTDDEPCPRCGAMGSQRLRRSLTSSLRAWFRSGGPLFPFALVCDACGYRWPGAVGAFWGGSRSSALMLPVHVVRGVVVAVQRQRTSEPVPWLYAAAGGLGTFLGIGVAAAGRGSGRGEQSGLALARGAAIGAVSGPVVCWCTFAATALTRHDTGSAVVDAVVVQVSPERHRLRLARREEEQAADVPFPVFGLEASWSGLRYLAGSSTQWSRGWRRPRIDSVTLGHTHSRASAGAPGFDEGVQVTNRAPGSPHDDTSLRRAQTPDEWADQLRREVSAPGGSAPAQQRDAVVEVDGTEVAGWSVQVVDRWVVVVRSPTVDVEVTGSGEAPARLRLDRVRDMSAYPSSLRSVAATT